MTGLRKMQTMTPSSEDVSSALVAIKDLDNVRASKDLKVFMVSVLEKIADGQSVSMMTSEHDYTTQDAADILRVSRTFLIKLLDEGKIPYVKIGKHRRILAKDLLIYKEKLEAERYKIMEEISQISQEIEDKINE